MGVYESEATVTAVLGGNRAGKTEIMAVKAVDLASGRHPKLSGTRIPIPSIGRVIAPKLEKNIRNVIVPKMQKLVRRVDLYGGSWSTAWHEKNWSLHFANGSVIRFYSYEQDINVFGGEDVDWVWLNEHCPKFKIYLENFARLVDRNGLLQYDFTPERGVTWEKEEILNRVGVSKEYKSFTFRTKGNPYLSKRGVDLFTGSIRDSRLLKAKTDGLMVPLSGLVFENFTYDRNVKKVADLPAEWHGRLPRQWLRLLILDSHRQKQHYMAIIAFTPAMEMIIEKELEIASPEGVVWLKKKIRAFGGAYRFDEFVIDQSVDGDSIDNLGEKSIAVQLRENDVDEETLEEIPGTGIPFLGTEDLGIRRNWPARWMQLTTLMSPDAITGKVRFFIMDCCPRAIEMFQNCVWKDDPTETETLRERVKPVNTEAPDVAMYGAALMPKYFGEGCIVTSDMTEKMELAR